MFWRHDHEDADHIILATPGEIYPVEIDDGPTSAVFQRDHSVRLEISSSNFPRFARNPNAGRSIAEETELRTARQAVYHDRKHPSHLLLPVTESANGM
jgi:uncharacterized protein